MDSSSSEKLLAWIASEVGVKHIAEWPDISRYIAREMELSAVKSLVLRGSVDLIVIGGQPPRCVVACEKPDDFENVRISQEPNQILVEKTSVSQRNSFGAVQIINGCVGVVAGRDLVVNGRIISGASTISQGMARPIVCISMPEIHFLSTNGSGDVLLLGVNQERIEITINGSGGIRAEGKVASMSVMIQGSGSVNASKLKAQSANLFVMGSGNVVARATLSVLAKVMGSGNIKLRGRPDSIDQSILGSGRVTFSS